MRRLLLGPLRCSKGSWQLCLIRGGANRRLHGKGQIPLGHAELAYQSLRRAYKLEKSDEAVPRELAGVCPELGKFDEAVSIAEQAVALNPKNGDLLGNLAIAYLLAGRLAESQKSIDGAIKVAPQDQINRHLHRIIREVADGKRPRPQTLAALSSTEAKAKGQRRRIWGKWWRFWEK